MVAFLVVVPPVLAIAGTSSSGKRGGKGRHPGLLWQRYGCHQHCHDSTWLPYCNERPQSHVRRYGVPPERDGSHDVVQSRPVRALPKIYSSPSAKQRYSAGGDFAIVSSKRVVVGYVVYGLRDMPLFFFFSCAFFLADRWRTTTWMRPRRRLQRRFARTRFARIGSSVAHLTSMLSLFCNRR